MSLLRDSYINYFRECKMPANIIVNGQHEMILTFPKTEKRNAKIQAKVSIFAEDHIEIYIYGIGNVRNLEKFYEKINDFNCKCCSYRAFADNSGRIVLWMDSSHSDKKILFQNIMEGVHIAEQLIPEFEEPPLEWIETIKADTTKEFMELLLPFEDTAGMGYSVNGSIYRGIHTRYGGYRKEVQEFRDSFGFMPDFDVTFYKQTVYLYDNEAESHFFEIYISNITNCADNERIHNTVGSMVRTLRELLQYSKEDIPILSADENLELKGALTVGVRLCHMKESDTGKDWLILDS